MDKKKGRYKWFLFGILFLMICLVIGDILIDKILPGKIKEKLAAIDPRIKVDVESVKASVLSSTIHFTGVSIQLLADTTKPSSKHIFHFDKIDLGGISFFSLIFRNKLSIGKVAVEKGEITLNEELLTRKELDGFAYLSDIVLPFEELSIDQFNMDKSKIEVIRKKDTGLVLFAGLNVTGISLKKEAKEVKSNFSSFQSDLSDIHYAIPESGEMISIKKISFGNQQDDWIIDSLRIIPEFTKYEFARKIGYQTDRIEAFVSTIHIAKPDWSQILLKKMVADKITVGPARVIVFRDRRITMKEEKKPMPASYFKDLPFEINIREAHLSPSFVTYEEFPKDGTQSGTLKIERLQIRISPLISHASASHDHVDMKVDGSVMGSGSVHADVYIPFKNDMQYEVAGSFTNLSLASLNESAENLGGFHIESGLLNHLYFKFSMNSEKSTGEIVGEYHELVIDKLKKSSNGEKKEDKFKSFILQNLIIPRNKDQSMPVGRRTGKVSYKRDPNRYFSHYMLHSLLSGVKASFRLGFLLPG